MKPTAGQSSFITASDAAGTQKLQIASSASSVLSYSTGFAYPSRAISSARFGSALNMETLVAIAERRDTPLETRNVISGTYLASQRSASSAALLVGDPTAMRDREMFVLEDTVGSTVA